MSTSFCSNLPLAMGPMFSSTLPPRAAALASNWMKCDGGLWVRSILCQPYDSLVVGIPSQAPVPSPGGGGNSAGLSVVEK